MTPGHCTGRTLLYVGHKVRAVEVECLRELVLRSGQDIIGTCAGIQDLSGGAGGGEAPDHRQKRTDCLQVVAL